MFSEQIKRAMDETHCWKWAIIALHSGLQGMMVLALKGSNGLNVLSDENKKQWLKWHNSDRCDKARPRDLKLASFLGLYKRIKSDRMKMYVQSRKFRPSETHDRSVGLLNNIRNDFIHFTPKVWGLELEGLPTIATDCLEIAEFLAWESGNVMWHRDDFIERLKTGFKSANESICAMRQKESCNKR